ncbi:MAG: PhoU domain-containing protein [Anaerolineales bacterium]
MLRKTFENEIQQLKDDVLQLGSMVEQAILDSVEALKKRDVKASEKVFQEDQQVNQKRFDIENKLMVSSPHNSRWRTTCVYWLRRWRSSQSWSAWAITPKASPTSTSAWATNPCSSR